MLRASWQRLVKRALDVGASCLGLAALVPVGLLVAAAIKLDSPGPVFFVQQRAGLNGRPFRAWKFRTMVPEAETQGLGPLTHAGDPRVTRVGRWLRATGLDELPQLWNVLRGEMSLVGPRPTLLYQVERYTPEQRRRLSVRPGLTGWAQVRGRNALTWAERIELDLWYIDHWSLWLDLKILAMTPWVIVTGRGVYTARLDDDISRPDASLPS